MAQTQKFGGVVTFLANTGSRRVVLRPSRYPSGSHNNANSIAQPRRVTHIHARTYATCTSCLPLPKAEQKLDKKRGDMTIVEYSLMSDLRTNKLELCSSAMALQRSRQSIPWSHTTSPHPESRLAAIPTKAFTSEYKKRKKKKEKRRGGRWGRSELNRKQQTNADCNTKPRFQRY